MRSIGQIKDESLARALGNVLYAHGVQNQIERDDDGAFTVWVNDEDQLDKGRELLERFEANPDEPAFARAIEKAQGLRTKEKRARKRSRAKTVDVRTTWAGATASGWGSLTMGLIIAGVALTIAAGFDSESPAARLFLIADPEVWKRGLGLTQVRHGQLWRLVTPILIHFSFLHIVFNMLWLRDLGGMIEARCGPWLLGAQVLLMAVFSNIAQYMVSGPYFGGMSGVVFGLLGYIWIRGRYDPNSRLDLHPQTVTFMTIWFFLCWTGLVGAIANIAHTAGLILGMAWGYFSTNQPRIHLRRLLGPR